MTETKKAAPVGWALRVLVAAVVAVAVLVGLGLFGAEQAHAATVHQKFSSVVMTAGQSYTMKMSGTKSKATWTSSNTKVASVNKSTGKVKAKKAGSAAITAKVGKKKYKATLTVAPKGTKTLVAYQSRSGTTKAVAKRTAKLTGGTLVQIKTWKNYPSDYDELTEVALAEQEADSRPSLATKVVNVRKYENVVLGYPIWWGTEPMLVRTFLDNHNLKGKVVAPFCTSQGSGFSGSKAGVKAHAKGADVKAGRDLTDVSNATIRKWLVKCGILEDAASTSGSSDSSSSADNSDAGSSTDTGTGSESTDPSSGDRKESGRTTQAGKTLVAYYSATEHTKSAANILASHLGADTFVITPVEPYTAADLNYNDSSSRVVREHNGDASARDVALARVTPGNFDAYDTVFIGYPIWWGIAAWPVDNFVRGNDFAGKTVVPFCTSQSSPVGQSAANLKAMAAGGTWLDGHRFSESESRSEQVVTSWADSLGLSLQAASAKGIWS